MKVSRLELGKAFGDSRLKVCAALGMASISNRSILDIGAGSGHIAAYFASKNAVTATDVENQLCVEGAPLSFVQLDNGAALPFSDASFDIVILNHVLTYISDQRHELIEIKRILKPDGVCYIALPNRIFPIEPHSKIPFLHYLPHALYEKLLRMLTGANEKIRMHSFTEMIKLFESAGFSSQDYTIEVLHDPARYCSGVRFRLPAWHWLTRISPTNIFILRVKALA